MTTAAAWWAGGRIQPVALGTDSFDVFVARAGEVDAPAATLLHGFPASSLEWAGLMDALAPTHRCLAPDFLGYGASVKPRGFFYDLDIQADLVEALWAADGVESTALISYDYGTIITQELLARRAEGRLAVEITGVISFNAGMIPEVYRPRLMQTLLADRRIGPVLALLLSESRFGSAWRETFADPARLTDATVAEHWQAVIRGGGRHVQGPLLSYIKQRAARAARMESVLVPSTPFRGLIWGMADPVSGAHVLAPLRERLPGVEAVELSDAGHVPHLEQPAAVEAAVLRLLG